MNTPRDSLGSFADPPFVAETLAWCNDLRAEQGREPLQRMPNGLRDDPESCPCGKAAGVFVDHETYGPTNETRWMHPLPEPVVAFVKAFDNGYLPHYCAAVPVEDDEW